MSKKKKKKEKLPVPKKKTTVIVPKVEIKSIKRPFLLASLLLFILLSFVLYFQCLKYGYVLDDKIAITENDYTKNGFAGIPDLLSTDTFMGYLKKENQLLPGGRYRPLSLITFAIEYQFFGLNSSVSHIINVFLYGLCGFFSFITLRRLFKEKTYAKKIFLSFSFLVSVLFILHPIHTEAVANIKGRDEIMAFIFSILTMFYALRYVDTRKATNLIFISILYFLGLLSKENTITFLAIIPFAILLFRKNVRGPLFKLTGLLFGLTILYLCLRFSIIDMFTPESKDLMNNPFVGMNGSEKMATIFYTLLEYLRLNLFPHPLTHDYYPYHIPKSSFGDLRVIISVLIHVLIVGAIFYFWKKRRKVSFALGFYLASMSIVSNIVVGVGTFMNERFAFMASLGICILMVYIVKELSQLVLKDKSKMLWLGLLGIIGSLFIYKNYTRIPAWKDELALNSQAIKVSKNSARCNSFMATAIFNKYKEETDTNKKKQMLDEALPYAKKAVALHPNYKNGNLMIAGIMGEKFKYNYNYDEFFSEMLSVITKRPDIDFITEYLRWMNKKGENPQLTQFYFDAAAGLVANRKLDWAIHYMLIANEYLPNDPRIRQKLVELYTQRGNPELAARYR